MQHEAVTDAGDQSRVVRFLADPATHGGSDVMHVQTHISHVFLAGDFVYKLKKAVTFPFLDFGTLDAREHDCREELRLNRRLAAAVYLDVLAVTDDGARLHLGGSGAAVDWVVRMRRLPDERALHALLVAGAVDPSLIEGVARHVAAFHATAPRAAGGDPESLGTAWRENLAGVDAMVGTLVSPADHTILDDFGPSHLVRHDAVLRARGQLGHVREVHGDLRLDHVYVLDAALPALAGAPEVPAGFQIVDCVEFSRAFRTIDVAADLSFLAMELEAAGRGDLATVLVSAYATAAGDALVPALIPYHAAYRAVVRGKVEGLAAADAAIDAAERRAAADRARALFRLAARFAWRAGDPVVIACTGLSGTGKSAVADMVAEATGFPVLRSDRLRRALSPEGDARYTAGARAAVYARLRQETERALAVRESVIVDATFLDRAERDRLARSVGAFGWRHVFVACEADETIVRARLDARDATSESDARWNVYLAQRLERDGFASNEPVLSLDTGRGLDVVREDLLPRLWAWRQGRRIPSTA
jgi:uncharacterized protein